MDYDSKTKRRLDAGTLARLLEGCGIFDAVTEELTAGMFNAAYLVTAGEQKYILKIAPSVDAPILRQERGIIRAEAAAMTTAGKYVGGVIPNVIKQGVDDASGAEYLLMEHMEGVSNHKSEGKPILPQLRTYRETGGYMRALHRVSGGRFGFAWQDDLSVACLSDRWSDTFTGIIENLLADAADVNAELPIDADVIRGNVERHRAALDMVKKPVFLHRDMWSGNVLARPNGKVTAIIDWERAMFGDPLYDFVMAMVEMPNLDAACRAAFYEGYGDDGYPSDDGVNARLSLYGDYLLLLLYIETYYRKYPNSAEQRQYLGAALRRDRSY